MENLPESIVRFFEAKFGTGAGWIAAIAIILLFAAPFILLFA